MGGPTGIDYRLYAEVYVIREDLYITLLENRKTSKEITIYYYTYNQAGYLRYYI